MEVEIFQDGKITKENASTEFKYSLIIELCNRIRKDGDAQEKSILEHVLAEICSLTSSSCGIILKYEQKRKVVVCKHQNSVVERSIETIVKKISGTLRNCIISNDVSSDARFKSAKKRQKRNLSLPVHVSKLGTLGPGGSRGKISLTSSLSPICVLIIPIPSLGQLALLSANTGRRFDISDVENILTFIPIITEALERSYSSDDGVFSTLNSTTITKSKETNDVKDVFLATVSHELRTPLNGIVGMITMLKDAGPLNEKQHEYLTILMECSHQLMTMMNNILDFSKMVSNRLVLLKGPMNISKSIRDASLMVEGKAKAKSLKFSIDIQQNIPILIGDGQRLTQILSNLLSNAVKFTEHGYVALKVSSTLYSPTAESEESLPYVKKWKVCFEVEDTGIGIPKTEQDRLFEVFHQSSNVDAAMARSGTGLGLSISKELVKMMNGKIEVFSEGIPGKGSRFKFYIITEEEIRMKDLEERHKDIIINSKILVVDDRPEYRMQLTDMLFKWGCRPTVVSSGEEALQYISHGIEFDTIIVDICMPYMSGIELTQEIKANKNTAGIPLIALSSVDLHDGTEMFDFYMNKPIDQNYLFPALLECLIKKKNNPGETPRNLSRKTSGRTRLLRKDLKILIAEDDSNNAYTIKEMLKYLGFSLENIKTVENGEKCVTETKRNAYDVVLMDILMPVMNGIEATKYIRQMNPRPYIIAVSAAVQNSDKQRCQQVGVDSYLTKPVLKEKLNAALLPLVTD